MRDLKDIMKDLRDFDLYSDYQKMLDELEEWIDNHMLEEKEEYPED